MVALWRGHQKASRRLPRSAETRPEHGAAAVEFALIAVPLLMLLIGIIQASLLLWAYQAGSHAAGEGARRYSVDPCVSHVELVKDRLGAATINRATTAVTVTMSATPVKVGDTVTVEVDYPVAVITGALIPGVPTSMTKSATARVEDVTGC